MQAEREGRANEGLPGVGKIGGCAALVVALVWKLMFLYFRADSSF